MSVGHDKGKSKAVMMDVEAWKLREQKEHREFRLQQVKEKIFPEGKNRKAPAEDSESEDGESEEEQEHGKVPCNNCRERDLVCEWSGTW
jgi:hypothetical protein